MSPIKSDLDDSELVIIDELRPMLQKFSNLLSQYISEDQRWRLGKVLTVIDASIADQEQRKAIKDIIHGFWWGNHGDSTPDALEMSNPHLDLNALCEALGFELHPSIEGQHPLNNSDYESRLDYRKKSYLKVANEK